MLGGRSQHSIAAIHRTIRQEEATNRGTPNWQGTQPTGMTTEQGENQPKPFGWSTAGCHLGQMK